MQFLLVLLASITPYLIQEESATCLAVTNLDNAYGLPETNESDVLVFAGHRNGQVMLIHEISMKEVGWKPPQTIFFASLVIHGCGHFPNPIDQDTIITIIRLANKFPWRASSFALWLTFLS